MATTVSFFRQTGMTTAERWWEVGRRVENGESFSTAERSVFGRFILDNYEFSVAYGWKMVNDAEYVNVMSILAYSLALEAEDAENGASFGDLPAPPSTLETEHIPMTADVVAEEEPMVDYTHFDMGTFVIPMKHTDRRRTWNQKVADGLRKWAHWMEERF